MLRTRSVHGPYGELWYDAAAQVHRVRLTAEGREKAAEYLTRYPNPIALFIAAWPAAYRAARAIRLTDDEINALCLEGVAQAFARYDPSRGAAVGTAVVWGLRAAVGNAVRRARRGREVIVVDFASRAQRSDCYYDESRTWAGEQRWIRTVSALHFPSPDGRSRHERMDDVLDAVDRADLTAQERSVLALRFGMGEGGPRSNAAVARMMKVSTERIRQVQEAAIRKVRAALGLDVNWAPAARSRIAACLASGRSFTKAEIYKRTGVPLWQLHEVLPTFLAEGTAVRERRIISRGRWCVVFRLRSADRSARVG